MKKVSFYNLFYILLCVVLLNGCITITYNKQIDDSLQNEVIETTNEELINKTNDLVNTIVKTSDNYKFTYNGNEKYLKQITDDMLETNYQYYTSEDKEIFLIPTPYIVKIDDSDKKDIKVFGDFYMFGYSSDEETFVTETAGSFPGCYHLSDEDGDIKVLSKEFAEDGSLFQSSMKKICNNDEDLIKQIFDVVQNDNNNVRIEYVKMFSDEYSLNINSIKDFGWPVIIFDDVSDEKFVYTFYKWYMNEVKEEDVLNDMPDRLNNLRNSYFTKEYIKKIEELSKNELDADPVIFAQDVTDDMINNLTTEKIDDNKVLVYISKGTENEKKIEVTIDYNNNKKFISNISKAE